MTREWGWSPLSSPRGVELHEPLKMGYWLGNIDSLITLTTPGRSDIKPRLPDKYRKATV